MSTVYGLCGRDQISSNRTLSSTQSNERIPHLAQVAFGSQKSQPRTNMMTNALLCKHCCGKMPKPISWVYLPVEVVNLLRALWFCDRLKCSLQQLENQGIPVARTGSTENIAKIRVMNKIWNIFLPQWSKKYSFSRKNLFI